MRLLIGLLLLSPVQAADVAKDKAQAGASGQIAKKVESIHLKTSDGWNLSARYRPAEHPAGENIAIVLLHGLAAGKDEWVPLEKVLAAKGISTLAIDLRGHGGSQKKMSQTMPFQSFADHGPSGEWTNMWKDAEAGFKYLESKGHRRIGVGGASVGANVVLMAAANMPKVHFTILFSPGIDYQGIRSRDALEKYGPRHLLVVVSPPDIYAYQSSQYLRSMRFAVKMPIDWIEAKAGHGAQMFQEPQIMDRVASWILEER